MLSKLFELGASRSFHHSFLYPELVLLGSRVCPGRLEVPCQDWLAGMKFAFYFRNSVWDLWQRATGLLLQWQKPLRPGIWTNHRGLSPFSSTSSPLSPAGWLATAKSCLNTLAGKKLFFSSFSSKKMQSSLQPLWRISEGTVCLKMPLKHLSN